MVAVGEIGAAYAATEQCITAEEHLGLGHVVGQATWGVAGDCYRNNAAVTEEYLIAVVQHTAKWWHILVISHTKACYTLLYVLGPGPVGIVSACLYTECVFDKGIAKYVVEINAKLPPEGGSFLCFYCSSSMNCLISSLSCGNHAPQSMSTASLVSSQMR